MSDTQNSNDFPLVSQEKKLGGEVSSTLRQRARELRQHQTPAEKVLWQHLRNRQLCNAKFRRQHNIGCYIVDFYCHKYRLVIEVDGEIHNTNQAEDQNREQWLNSLGLKVLRFSNQDVLQNIESVLQCIIEDLTPTLS